MGLDCSKSTAVDAGKGNLEKKTVEHEDSKTSETKCDSTIGNEAEIESNSTETATKLSDQARMTPVIEYHLEKYKLKDQIGSGMQGEVRIAEDANGNHFAVKVIPKKKTLFRRRNNASPRTDLDRKVAKEVNLMKELDHPNIVRLFEVVDSDLQKKLFLVMELVDGGPVMGDKLIGQEPFSEAKALDLFRQLLKGLEYLHFKGVVHRDIKPSNLLVTKSGLLKISDFGISFICESKSPANKHRSAPKKDTKAVNDAYKAAFDSAVTARERKSEHSTVRFSIPDNSNEISGPNGGNPEAEALRKEKVIFSANIKLDQLKNEEHQRLLGKLYPPTPKLVSNALQQNRHNDSLRMISGTFAFIPPEAFSDEAQNEYNGKIADLWASGISLYMFLFGMVPFLGETNAEIIGKITNSELNFPPFVPILENEETGSTKRENVELSAECKDFISKFLEKDSSERITSITEAKSHVWVKTGWKRSIPENSSDQIR